VQLTPCSHLLNWGDLQNKLAVRDKHRPTDSTSTRLVVENTEKLDLPPIHHVQTRGSNDASYYNASAVQQRPLYVTERLPALPLPQPGQAYSSSLSSPRVSSISSSVGSSAGSFAGSQSSFTSAASSNGPKTPGTLSPTLQTGVGLSGPPPGQAVAGFDHYPAMNHAGPDMYYHNMSAAQAPQPQQVQSYNPHQQPPLLQPGPGQYPPPSYGHPQYSYNNGLTSPPQGPPQVSNSMVAQNVLPLPGGQQGMGGGYQSGFDTTGQIAPPGMKPRVTATLWEDEGSLCFQVEARGICVARREGMLLSILSLVRTLPLFLLTLRP